MSTRFHLRIDDYQGSERVGTQSKMCNADPADIAARIAEIAQREEAAAAVETEYDVEVVYDPDACSVTYCNHTVNSRTVYERVAE